MFMPRHRPALKSEPVFHQQQHQQHQQQQYAPAQYYPTFPSSNDYSDPASNNWPDFSLPPSGVPPAQFMFPTDMPTQDLRREGSIHDLAHKVMPKQEPEDEDEDDPDYEE
jgi:hypothetical protein